MPRVRLNEQGPIPLHQQLREILATEIGQGRFTPGARIPSERELCRRYGVSRTTVRQTVNGLVYEGRLTRIPARGTFVAPPKIEQDLARVNRFSETIAAIGHLPRIRIVSESQLIPDRAIQDALELPPAEEVVRLEIVGYADEDPLVLYRVHLPKSLGQPVVAELLRAQAEGMAAFSMILDAVRRLAGLAASWAVQSYEAGIADEETARLLGVQMGDPVFVSTRTIFTNEGAPIEYDEVLYRGDRYRFTIRRAYPLYDGAPPVHGGRR